MTDTPRTDFCGNNCGGVEMMWLAGTLERELAAMTAAKNEAVAALKEAQSVMYPPGNGIPITRLVGSPQDMKHLITKLEEIK